MQSLTAAKARAGFGRVARKVAERMAMAKRKIIHHGSDFTRFLRDEGVYEEVEAAAIKKAISTALAKQMERRGVTVSELAQKLGTSRAALNRVLDEDNTSITLTTRSRTAAALGCRVNLQIVAAR